MNTQPTRRLGIVSDTHGHIPNTRDAVRLLESLDVAEVIHCGDIGSLEVVDLLAAWPTHFVLGNVDSLSQGFAQHIEAAGQTFHDRFGSLEISDRKIAFLHGDDGMRLDREIASGAWDLVCHGHTHVAHREQFDKTWVLNPGAIYRANPYSIAVVDLPAMKIEHVTF